MAKNKVIYWIATGLVIAVMGFSAVNFNLANPVGPMKGAFAHLGFPDYFRIELTVAKILGVFALLIPGVPSKRKELAYAGFAITLVSASIAHFSSGDPVLFVIDPLLFLGALVTSYAYFIRLERHTDDRRRIDDASKRAAFCGGPSAACAVPSVVPSEASVANTRASTG
jgi:hypothetical protein